MKLASIDFPDELLYSLRNNTLVIFAGAGVSMGPPAYLPNFKCLTQQIAEGTGFSPEEPLDRFLGKLHHKGVDVHVRATRRLSLPNLKPTALHCDLLRLFKSTDCIKVVTTNFDLLFEDAAQTLFPQSSLQIFSAPALPLGRSFQGIVHVHGAVKRPQEIVLTDADFGRAYLTEGWARRFLVEVFQHYTVLFVGYSYDDTVMHYLARALPVREARNRFILVEAECDSQRWNALGITPVIYRKLHKDDFSILYEGIQRLADMFSRGILGWKYELITLAEGLPPIDEESMDLIDYCFKNPATLRLFTQSARLPEWITWLDKCDHFRRLFSDDELNDCDRLLASWLAEHFAVRFAFELISIIAKHDMHIHPDFWRSLGRKIACNDESQITEPLLSQWTTVLIATAPARLDKYILLRLAERCAQVNASSSLLQIFDLMARCRPKLTPSIVWPSNDDTLQRCRMDVDLSFYADFWALNEAWEKCLKPNLPLFTEHLLSIIVRKLEDRHFALSTWHNANRDWDAYSLQRVAIESHEKNKYREELDVLVDAARDCLEWLASNQAFQAGAWSERLVHAKPPLLRRLAVHAINACSSLSPDEKLCWLMDHIDIHDHSAHHEIYRAVHLAYPQSSADIRKNLIKVVLAYHHHDDNDPDKDRLAAHTHFDWLHWLHSADSKCPLVKEALENVSAKYPDFKANEHSDLTLVTTSEWVLPQSPWTTEELQAKPAFEWLPDLLAYQGKRFIGPDREVLLQTITETATKDFKWGQDLAEALMLSSNWESDLWTALVRSWSEWRGDETTLRQVLDCLSREELHRKHARVIAEALRALVKGDGKPYVPQLLSQANKTASILWQCVKEKAELLQESDDWLRLAINHPAGVLAEYWLNSLSVWRKQQEDKPPVLNDEYRQILTAIVQDDSLAGALGRTVLCSQFAFLFSIDEAWTRDHLLPLFSTNSSCSIFQQAWDGFLTRGRLFPAVADALELAFLKAATYLDRDFVTKRDRFIEYYTFILAFYVKDPLNTWIPTLFNHCRENDCCSFAAQVESCLRDMDKPKQQDLGQRWLKQYWENRLQGVPVPLKEQEIAKMLEWLPHLADIFPEAVTLATRMPQVPSQQSSLIYELSNSEIITLYPDAVAQLLVYLLIGSSSPDYIWYGLQDIITKLDHTTIEPTLKQKLTESITVMGLAWY